MRVRMAFASEPGDPAVDNEDFVATSVDPAGEPWAAVVLDGVTPMDRSDIGCQHGVAWFARSVGEHLIECALRTATSLTDCLAEAIALTRDSHADTCDLEHPDSPAATVAAARGRADRLDYLVLSDAAVILDIGGQVRALTDHRAGDVSRRLRAEGTRPTASLVRSSRNRPGGYWVAAERPEAAYESAIGGASLSDLRRLLVATDGATRLVDTFGVLDWPAALDAVHQDGPEAWIARTRSAEREADERAANERAAAESGACGTAAGRVTGVRRGKVHDDATIVLVEPVGDS